jgi:GNAT superfamily N-acetyltransferase
MGPDDVDDVRVLICRTIRISYQRAYSPQAIAFFEDYHSLDNIRRDARQGTTLVAFMEKAIVGTGTLLDGEIKRVFVDPEHQGRGVGRELMMSLIAEARTQGLRSVSLDASLVSRGMYEHLGFRFLRNGRHDLGNDLVLDYYQMVLDL